MTKDIDDPLAQIAHLQRRMAESLRPLAELQERLNTVLRPWSTEFEKTARHFANFNEQLTKALAPTAEKFAQLVKNIVEVERQSRLLDQAGFVPHISTPLHLVNASQADPENLSKTIEVHYRENWPQIRDHMLERVRSFRVDDEAKEAFQEALIAHEHGLYRANCRHLLSEIERVARVELHGDTLATITSQKTLQELAGSLSPSEVEPRGYFSLKLFKRLSDHLYKRVQNEDERKKLAADPVPNRHAAIHGLVVYRTFKHSLNTIFLTDYVLQVVDVVKNNRDIADRANRPLTS